MKILLIEDDVDTAESLKRLLTQYSIHCDTASCAEAGLLKLSITHYDLFVVDLMLYDDPDKRLIQRIRMNHKQPIIVLSSSMDKHNTVQALLDGSDDYVCKPVNTDELVIRMRRILERLHGYQNNKVILGKVIIDLGAKRVYTNGHEVKLSAKEFDFFKLLATRSNTTLSKTAIIDYLYNDKMHKVPALKIVDVLACKVRKKLKEFGDILHTRWGIGYTIELPHPLTDALVQKPSNNTGSEKIRRY